MRVSNQWVVNSFLNVLNRNQADLAKLQIQVSSGKQITTPSENPVNNALAMQNKTEILEHGQYTKNIARVTEWLDNTDSVLSSLESALQRARELAVQGANDTLVRTDRDAIAEEIDQILAHVIDIANTDIGGEYIFAGGKTDSKPITSTTGQTPYSMKDLVTYSLGEDRSNLNLTNILGVAYNGNNIKLPTEIEKGVILEKNLSGSELFFRGDPIVPQPSFADRAPPLTDMTRLDTLNQGKGVEKGNIILTDSNGIEHWIDLKYARRLDEVLFAINATNSFSATIDEVPSDTALKLGVATNVGQSSKITGQPILFLTNPAQDFDPSVATLEQLGVPPGFLSIFSRDGKNRRVTVQSDTTLQQLINDINALDGGLSITAEFEPTLNRLVLTDKTTGTGEFTIKSSRSELKIYDLPAHTAADLGLAATDSGSDGVQNNLIVSAFNIDTAGAVLSTVGPGVSGQFSGFMGLFQNVGGGNLITSPANATIGSAADTLASLNGGNGVTGGSIMITSRDQTKTLVNLNGSTTINDVITEINTQTGGRQTASWDNGAKQFLIQDNTAGPDNFRIEQAVGPENVALASINNGVEGGYLQITSGNPAFSTTVNLTNAKNLGDVIDAINVQAPHVVASYNTTTRRLEVLDLQPGGGEFQIAEVNGNNNIAVRDATSIANRLGILGSDSGDTIFGTTINAPDPTTLLSALTPPPEKGSIVLKDAAGGETLVDLNAAQTVQDVMDAINNTGKFTAAWDDPLDRLVIKDISGAVGSEGIQIQELTNTARDLGFISGTSLYRNDNTNNNPKDVIVSAPIFLKALPTLIGGIDLNPAVVPDTKLSSLNADRPFNPGVALGRIRINDRAFKPNLPGHSATIDLRGLETIQDVLDAINDPVNGLAVQARINASRNGIELLDKNEGAGGRLSVVDLDSSSAADLGFGAKNYSTVDNLLVGGDVNPGIDEDTLVSTLRVQEGGIKLGRVYIQSGEFSGEIDLSGANTVKDIVLRFNEADPRFNLNAWIDPDSKRINLTNTKDQSFIKVRDLGDSGENAASGLGLGGSLSIFETLIDLRDSLYRTDTKAISDHSIRLISEDLERVLSRHAEVGVKTNRASFSQERQENFTLNLKKMLEVVENVDMAEAITRMTQLETAFRAALQTGARIMQTTLMDFLR